jgi:hypothetical protein
MELCQTVGKSTNPGGHFWSQFENTPQALANFSPRFGSEARTLGYVLPGAMEP